MSVKKEIKNGCLIFYFEDNLDIFNAEKIKHYLKETIENSASAKVIFNFDMLDELDSIGISVFVKINNMMKGVAEIRLCCVKNNVERAMRYTHLDDFFNIDETEEDSILKLTGK